jgi:hypothetical protein
MTKAATAPEGERLLRLNPLFDISTASKRDNNNLTSTDCGTVMLMVLLWLSSIAFDVQVKLVLAFYLRRTH